MSVILPLCVCVYVYSCWDSPWLNQASYTSTSSQLHLSLSVEGLMSSLTPLHPPWISHGKEGDEEKWRKRSLVGHHSFLFTLGVWKNPKMLAVTNRAIKLYGPAEHATLLMLQEVMQKWLHPHWWIYLSTYYYDISHSHSCKQRQLKILVLIMVINTVINGYSTNEHCVQQGHCYYWSEIHCIFPENLLLRDVNLTQNKIKQLTK